MESGFEVYSRYFWKAGLDQFLHWLEEIRDQQACIEFTSPAICFSKKETYRQELHGTFEYMVQFHARHDHILIFWASSTSSFHRCYTFAIEALYTISPSSRFQIICAASSIEHLLRQSCSFTCHPLPSPTICCLPHPLPLPLRLPNLCRLSQGAVTAWRIYGCHMSGRPADNGLAPDHVE
jgi:hypothetical protein